MKQHKVKQKNGRKEQKYNTHVVHKSEMNDSDSLLERKSGAENCCSDSRILIRSNKALPKDNCSSEYTQSRNVHFLSRSKSCFSLNIDAFRPIREKPLLLDKEEQAINLTRLLELFRQLKRKLCDRRRISSETGIQLEIKGNRKQCVLLGRDHIFRRALRHATEMQSRDLFSSNHNSQPKKLVQ